MTTLYLMRHGQSQHNAAFEEQKTPFVAVDEFGSHLTELGQQQAQAAAQELEPVTFDAVYASDYYRARETAAIIATTKQLSVNILPQLRERDWGSLQGKNYGTVLEKMEALRQGLSDQEKLAVKLTPDMESELDGAQRLDAALRSIAEKHPYQTLLIVSHGNVMRSWLKFLGLYTYDDLRQGTVINCGYAVFGFQQKKWQLRSENLTQ